MPSKPPVRIEFANLLRGLAAVGVMLSHYIAVFWYRPEVVANFLKIPNFSTDGYLAKHLAVLWINLSPLDTGPIGVAVFFLISGFVIPFSAEKLTRHQFAINRIFRIYPTYFAGFAVTSVTILMVDRFFEVPFGYSTHDLFVHAVAGLRELFAGPSIDGVVWTLEIELKFYFIWLLVGPRKIELRVLAAIAMTLLAIQLVLTKFFAISFATGIIMYSIPYLVFFLIGTLTFMHHTRRISRSSLMVGALSLFTAMIFARWLGPEAKSLNVLINYAVGAVIFFGFYAYPKPLNKSALVLEPLARISYPLYAAHSVLGYGILRLSLNFGLGSFGIFLAFAASIAIAFAIHNFVEVPSTRLGRRLSRA